MLIYLVSACAQPRPQKIASPPGTSLLEHSAHAEAALHSFAAEITLTRQTGSGPVLKTTGSVLVEHPNLAQLTLQGDDPPRHVVSDGRELYTLAASSTYTRVPVDRTGRGLAAPWWMLPVRFFFTGSVNPFGADPDAMARLSDQPAEMIGGVSMRVLQVAGLQPMPYRARFFFDPNGLMLRSEVLFGDAKEGTRFVCELAGVRRNPRTSVADFRFIPPPGVTLDRSDLADALLAPGDSAPAFTLPTPGGERLSLTALRFGARATLVNFWYLNCPPCRIEFPAFEQLYTELHSKGLNAVAIDKADSGLEVSRYLRRTGITFPVLLGGEPDDHSVFASYRVSTFPVTYLLDGEGRIVFRTAGADVKGLKEALTRLGLQSP